MVFEVGGRAAFLEFGGLHPAPPGLRLTLRRWGALLALAGLALPGVRAAEAGAAWRSPVLGPLVQTTGARAADTEAEPGAGPGAEEAAPRAGGEGSLLPMGEPWEAVVSEPSLPAPTSTSPGRAAAAAVPAPAEAPDVVGETARSVPGSDSPAAATSRPALVPAGRDHLRPILRRYALENSLPPDLVMALAWRESSWRAGVVSTAGAVGVMQLMPSTVTFTSRTLLDLGSDLDPRNATANIRMGTRFFAHLVEVYGGSYRRALIAYNQGVTALRTKGTYPGAERFAERVLALRSEFENA